MVRTSRSTSGAHAGAGGVTLTLSSSQVEKVLEAAAGQAELRGLLPTGDGDRAREQRYRELLEDRRLSRSLLAGLLVLACLPPDGELGVAELARRIGMRTSTTHRYLSTLLAAGLLEQDPASRRYRLAAGS